MNPLLRLFCLFAVLPLLAATDTFDSNFDTGPAAAAFGVRLTRLEDVIRAESGSGTK